MTYRHRKTTYYITVENPHGVSCGVGLIELDGTALAEPLIALAATPDGGTPKHTVRVVLKARPDQESGIKRELGQA